MTATVWCAPAKGNVVSSDEAAEARLELIYHARLTGLSVEPPEQIQSAPGKIREPVEREAGSDG